MEARTRNLIIGGVIAVALVLIVLNLGEREPVDVDVEDSDPSIGTGNLTVFLFEDYRCSHCLDYSLSPAYAALLDTWVDPGHITLVFKHVAFVDPQLSLSNAVASRCVFALEPAAWSDFDHAIYQLQADGGLPDAQTVRSMAVDRDVDGASYDACIQDDSVADAVAANTQALSAMGRGTPTIVIDGMPYNPNDTAAVDAAIQEAR